MNRYGKIGTFVACAVGIALFGIPWWQTLLVLMPIAIGEAIDQARREVQSL